MINLGEACRKDEQKTVRAARAVVARQADNEKTNKWRRKDEEKTNNERRKDKAKVEIRRRLLVEFILQRRRVYEDGVVLWLKSSSFQIFK